MPSSWVPLSGMEREIHSVMEAVTGLSGCCWSVGNAGGSSQLVAVFRLLIWLLPGYSGDCCRKESDPLWADTVITAVLFLRKCHSLNGIRCCRDTSFLGSGHFFFYRITDKFRKVGKKPGYVICLSGLRKKLCYTLVSISNGSSLMFVWCYQMEVSEKLDLSCTCCSSAVDVIRADTFLLVEALLW